MSWDATLAELAAHRDRARAMGGPDRLAAHRGSGKLDARGRIDALLDPGSFREIGTLAGAEVAADGIVTGYAAGTVSAVAAGLMWAAMPARSAIVGFSVENLYATAELMRRQTFGPQG